MFKQNVTLLPKRNGTQLQNSANREGRKKGTPESVPSLTSAVDYFFSGTTKYQTLFLVITNGGVIFFLSTLNGGT